jgi:predicted enzyme related to lactoylglutathione lyase
MKVKELRLILTVENLEEIISFYRDAVGLETSKEWHEPTGNGIILEAGRASLELIDRAHAQRIDEIEVGKQISGTVRIALNVGNEIHSAAETLSAAGAVILAEKKQAPWSMVQRIADPAGMQITLFEQSTLFTDDAPNKDI